MLPTVILSHDFQMLVFNWSGHLYTGLCIHTLEGHGMMSCVLHEDQLMR